MYTVAVSSSCIHNCERVVPGIVYSRLSWMCYHSWHDAMGMAMKRHAEWYNFETSDHWVAANQSGYYSDVCIHVTTIWKARMATMVYTWLQPPLLPFLATSICTCTMLWKHTEKYNCYYLWVKVQYWAERTDDTQLLLNSKCSFRLIEVRMSV
jgi:hypothetical protein